MPKPWRPFTWIGPDDKKGALACLDVVSKNLSTALDSEFPTRGPRKDEVVIWSLSGAADQRYVLDAYWLKSKKSPFREWIQDPTTKLVYFSFPADADVIEQNAKIDCEASFYSDVKVLGWLRDNTKRRHALKEEGFDYLKWYRRDYAHMFGYVPDGKKKWIVVDPITLMYGPLPPEMLRTMTHEEWIELFKHYSADDAEETHTLHRVHKVVLKRWGYWDMYLKLDRPYTLTLRHFQKAGIPIDMVEHARLNREITHELVRHRTNLRAIAGKPELSLDSQSKDLRALIFDEWNWPVYDDLQTAKGAPQLNKVAWSRYANEEGFLFARNILPHNKLKTLKNTFINGIGNGVKYGPGADRNILFSEYNQTGTRTGRMSSRKFEVTILVPKVYVRKPTVMVEKVVKAGMNMLNFPNRFNDLYGVRRVVHAPPPDKDAPEGYRLICGDFAGFELWMILFWCHKWGIDSKMLKHLDADEDVHSMTAVAVCNLPCDWTEVKKLFPEKRNEEGKRCYHPDTEVLTRKGWRRIGDLTLNDDVAQAEPHPGGEVSISWTKPLALQRFKHDSNALVHLKAEGIDLRVTPDHRMLGFDVQGRVITPEPEQFHRAKTWANAGVLQGARLVDESMLRVAVAVQADGSYEGNRIRLGFTRKRKIKRMKRLLHAAGLPYTIERTKQMTRFVLAEIEATRVKKYLDAKKLPWWWLDLTVELREAVLDEVLHWDGSRPQNCKMYVYDSVDSQNSDVLQALATITGRKTRAVTTERQGTWKPMTRLTIRDRSTSARTENLKQERFAYTDDVVCLSVPTTFVVVRDGGVPVISGNCNFGLGYGAGPAVFCRIMGWDTRKESNIRKAKRVIATWCDLWPEMPAYQQKCVDIGYKQGWLPSIAGGRTWVRDGLNSSDDGIVHHTENICKNAPAQRSAAEITKMAQNMIDACPRLRRIGYKQAFNVYDEVVGWAPGRHADEATALQKHWMERPFKKELPFRLRVEIRHADTWHESKGG